jgi:hypothetical protein
MNCPECGKFVKDGSLLREHERTAHPETVGRRN